MHGIPRGGQQGLRVDVEGVQIAFAAKVEAGLS
jgi:hypothetical protein